MSLDSWYDIIRRQGEESTERQRLRVEAMEAEYNEALQAARRKEDAELLDYYDALPRSSWDQEEQAIWDRMRLALRDEIIRRMQQ